MIRKTVVTHRLKELRHLRAVEKLATWRRTYGFDRLEDGDDKWIHGPLPPTPEKTTASMWADLNALKDALSMSGKEISSQRAMSFINELDQGTASVTDEEFAMLKRMIVERRGRNAAGVAPTDTARPCSPQSRSSEISFDLRVCMEGNDKGRMYPEPGELKQSSDGTDQLESPSTGTGFESPGQQCLPNWGIERITAEGCLLAGVVSNLRGDIFSLEELVTGLPKDKKTANEENKQFDPGGKRRGITALKSGCTGIRVLFSFPGELWVWTSAACVLCFSACLFVVHCSYQVIIFLRAEAKMGREKKTNDERNRRASIFLPPTP